MSADQKDAARKLAINLVTSCLADAEATAGTVAATFRCWTPFHDWQQGKEAVAALRQVVRASLSKLGADEHFVPSVIIANEKGIVLEASSAGEPGQMPASLTILMILASGLVNEARCFVDPAVINVNSVT